MKRIKGARKWKMLKEAIRKTFYFDRYVLVSLIIATYTVAYGISSISGIKELYQLIKYTIEQKKDSNEVDMESIEQEIEEYIMCIDTQANIDTGYKIVDETLVTSDNKKVYLTNSSKPLALGTNGITNKTLEDMNLKGSNIEFVLFDFVSITDGFVYNLPKSLKAISISRCDYITDLSGLDTACPDLEELYIERITSINSFDFIYKLNNLKVLSIKDTYGITDELLDYCKIKGITVFSNRNEVENTKEIKKIASEILTPNMTESEKIRTICNYVVDNIKYNRDLSSESNTSPINCALNNEGVCISYAYLTSALFKEANITSYRVNSQTHVWNLVNIDGEYFYIDNTNIDSMKCTRLIYKIFGVSPFYMSDPNQNRLLSTKDAASISANIPTELKLDILALEDEKTLIEKYGSTVGLCVICVLEIALSILFLLGIPATIDTLEYFFETIWDIEFAYKELKEKELQRK